MAYSETTNPENSWFRACIAGGVPRRSAYVALIVGTILTAINQGDALIAGGELNYLKLVPTYLVPYLVATYGAATARRAPFRAASGQGSG